MRTEMDIGARWRTSLFVPAMSDRFIDKAVLCEADALIIDLEDSVLPEHKVVARSRVPAIAERLHRDNVDVVVRINRPLSQAIRDIEASVGPHVSAFMIAKAESAAHLALLGEVIGECEVRASLPLGQTALFPLLESAGAIQNMDEICRAPRVVAVACGDEDLAADLGCSASSETIASTKSSLVISAARAMCQPIGIIGTIAEYKDLERYRSYLALARDVGLQGTLCIHPAQVQLANGAFSTSESEVGRAQQIVDAYREARERGSAAVGLDGTMIDAPIVRRAEHTLRLNALGR